MLRSLYIRVLRLHPSGFRQRFGDEMLSIFDRKEQRAAFGLLVDGLISLARQWAFRPEFWHDKSPASIPQHRLDGIPSFCTLDPFRPHTAAVFHGMVLSMAIFSVTCFAIKYSWIRVLHVRIAEGQLESKASTQPSSIKPSASQAGFWGQPTVARHSADNAPIVTPATPSPSLNTTTQVSTAPDAVKKRALQLSAKARSEPWRAFGASLASKSQDAAAAQDVTGIPDTTGTTIPAEDQEENLDAAERRRVIDGAIANVKRYYVYPDVAQKIVDGLLVHEKSGDDEAQTDGASFADLLTRQMREVSHDRHLKIVYNRVATPERSTGPSAADLAHYREDMKQSNCMFEKVEILPRNIGYLKFNEFPDPSICRQTMVAAMHRLNDADAIIFDLRNNHGGDPKMVAQIATYLFDHPTHLNDIYDRSSNATQQYWTQPPAPGNKLADKPAYVLTSESTFSAAEEFSYDLQMLKRVVIVGETTSGRGHLGSAHRIDDHFEIHVPDWRPINPISKTNWQGTGVEPDVKVKAVDALETAEKLARSKLHK